MPIYHVACAHCGDEQDVYRSVAQYNDLPECCGSMMNRQVTAPYVMTDMQPYKSMITGEMITSRSQHRDHLKAHNCIEIGNETKYLKPKEKIDLAPESKKARKQKIIEQVNALK
jgi:hypothetical protein